MATFSTFTEVLAPDDPFLKRGQEKGFAAGFVLADVLRQTGGTYQTTAPMSEKFRVCIRAVAGLTSDDELLRIADLPDVPVSLENCRQQDRTQADGSFPATPAHREDPRCGGARRLR